MSDIVLKSEYRVKAQGILNQLDAQYTIDALSTITNIVLKAPEIIYSKVVLVYMSFGKEVGTQKIIKDISRFDKIICVPKLINGKMYAVKLSDKLIVNRYGIYEPAEDNIITEIDTAIVPGLLFDINKNRLGRGKGYYDQYFESKKIFKLAVAYDCQIIDSVPVGSKDIAMNKIITEKRIIN